MVSNPDLIYYVCIARDTTILAEFTKEPQLEDLARQCIQRTPPYHSMFSHTVRKRTYTFLIDDPFVYFAIFDEQLDQSEGLWFLNRVKTGFEEGGGSKRGSENLSSHCFQAEFDSILRENIGLGVGLVDSTSSLSSVSQNPSLDSSRGGQSFGFTPLLGVKPVKGLKKKKRLSGETNGDSGKDSTTAENTVDVYDDVNGVSNREFTTPMQKSVSPYSGDRQKAKQFCLGFGCGFVEGSNALIAEIEGLDWFESNVFDLFVGEVSVVY
ncbi:Longin domain containing protein [Trema orientale]|uniref:Longin domain containing protein n=1 Tax=Trema orientale TaxID=63057 RepID=A0A2P5E6S9_TREOI|nr:Longin domain containing protein [Trema orientale]